MYQTLSGVYLKFKFNLTSYILSGNFNHVIHIVLDLAFSTIDFRFVLDIFIRATELYLQQGTIRLSSKRKIF